jgi:hypothetical protein
MPWPCGYNIGTGLRRQSVNRPGTVLLVRCLVWSGSCENYEQETRSAPLQVHIEMGMTVLFTIGHFSRPSPTRLRENVVGHPASDNHFLTKPAVGNLKGAGRQPHVYHGTRRESES